LQSWQDADPRHRAALTRFSSAWGALDRPLNTGAAERVLSELAARAQRRRRRRFATVAGGLAAMLALGLLWPVQRPAADSAASTVAVTTPERRVLPDGSVVELKAGAAIAVNFNAEARGVTLLHGEVHFQVTKDPARPFIVTARSVAVRAVGTAFSVDLGHDAVEVLVTEGTVAVDRDPMPILNGAAQSLPMKLATVEAGSRLVVESAQLLALTPAAEVQSVPPAELSERLAWRRPRLEFSGTPLAEAVALVNQHNRVKFVIDDPALAGVRVSGLLRADNTEGFLQLLRVSLGVEAELRGDTVIGLRRTR